MRMKFTAIKGLIRSLFSTNVKVIYVFKTEQQSKEFMKEVDSLFDEADEVFRHMNSLFRRMKRK